MHLAIGNAVGHEYIGHGVRLREEILHLFAGLDIPVRNLRLLHRLEHRGLQALLRRLALTHVLHRLEGQARVYAFGNQMRHDVVTRRNRFGNRLALLDEILRIVQPYVRTVRIAGYTHNLAEALRLYVADHLAHELRAALRNAEGADLAANLLRRYTERRGVLEDTHRFLITDRNALRIKVRIHVLLQIFFQHLQNHRIIVAKNIQLNQTVVDAVIIIVCRDGFAGLVIGRTVHRRDIVNIHITRHNHDAAWMLAGRALDACQTAHERSNLRRMHGNALFLVILADIANGCLVRNRGNRTCAAHVVAAKKLLGILMRDALVGHSRRIIGVNTAGEVQVDIRNLVAMEAKENCERNIMTVAQHPRAAFRTFLRRQVEAAVHLIVQEELAVTAMRTAIVRLQRVNLGDVEHRRYEGRADAATRANEIAAVNRVLNELMRNIIQNGEAVADNRVQLHLQAVLDKLRQLIAIPGMSLGIGKVAHRLLRTGDERRIQLVTVRHRLEALHHIADFVRIRNHDLIGRLLAQIGELLEHFLRRMQIQRRLHIRVLIFLAGLQNRT